MLAVRQRGLAVVGTFYAGDEAARLPTGTTTTGTAGAECLSEARRDAAGNLT